MIKIAQRFFFLSLFCLHSHVLGENLITFFIRPDYWPHNNSQEYLTDVLQKTGQLARVTLSRLIEVGSYQGILASYMGYVTISDYTGQITFPRLHAAPAVHILITPMIEPVMMIGATVHHLETLSALPSQMFSITRKQNDQTKIFFWDVQEVPIPENRRISLDTIILFTKPENILVPIGITETDDSPMLKLPTMYAKRELNVSIEALRVLKVRHFFGPVFFNYTKQNDLDYAKQLVPS